MSNFYYMYITEDHLGNSVNIDCEIEYEEPERGLLEDGLQITPYYPACVTLWDAKINNVSVYFLLSDQMITSIENEALNQKEDY